MNYKFFKNVKNILLKNKFFSHIISIIYIQYNKIILKNDINIFKKSKFWIHKTSIGLVPSEKPILNPELYVKNNFEIFFEKYHPKENDTVVEFGSGVGCETLYISKNIGAGGKIFAFEPFNEVYNYLIETINLNKLDNVYPINKALYKNSSGIGFKSDLDNWLSGKIDNESISKVPTTNLNDFISNQNIEKINFCKLNVEGAEKYIVENSNLFFDICDNIAIECHDFIGKDEFKTFDIVKHFLISKNYIISFSKRNKFSWDKFYIYGRKNIKI